MGFTVVGDRFFASGHPGFGERAPGNLGLLESTNNGGTWTTLSLAGEADFHALDGNESVVYGVNGGELLASADRRQWDSLGPLPAADLAVHPSDTGTLLATTEAGLQRSVDGGRSFSRVDGAPLLQLIDFADERTVVGVAPDGAVHVSADGGATWARAGSAGGAPHAMTAHARDVYVALEGRVVASKDRGATFDEYV